MLKHINIYIRLFNILNMGLINYYVQRIPVLLLRLNTLYCIQKVEVTEHPLNTH